LRRPSVLTPKIGCFSTFSPFVGYFLGFPLFVRFRGVSRGVSVSGVVSCPSFLPWGCRPPWQRVAVSVRVRRSCTLSGVPFLLSCRSAVKIAFFWRFAVPIGYFIESEKTAVFWGGFACGCCRA
jgi:hypothetical protein